MANEKFLQRELARTLIKYRERKGLTKEEAIWFLGTSKDILGSYESGKLQFMEPGIVIGWLSQYGAPQAVIDDAAAKAKWIRQGNPANWQESAPEGFARFTQIELLAATIDIHEDAYVWGPLQTPGYAEAVLATNPNLNDEKRREAVGFRLQRADSLFGRQAGPPRMRIIMSEVALTRFKGADFYEDQIDNLVQRNRVEGVDIHIALREAINPSTSWSYQILSFDDDRDPDLVYMENLFGGQYHAESDKVAWCRKLFSATVSVVMGLEEWSDSRADK